MVSRARLTPSSGTASSTRPSDGGLRDLECTQAPLGHAMTAVHLPGVSTTMGAMLSDAQRAGDRQLAADVSNPPTAFGCGRRRCVCTIACATAGEMAAARLVVAICSAISYTRPGDKDDSSTRTAKQQCQGDRSGRRRGDLRHYPQWRPSRRTSASDRDSSQLRPEGRARNARRRRARHRSRPVPGRPRQRHRPRAVDVDGSLGYLRRH